MLKWSLVFGILAIAAGGIGVVMVEAVAAMAGSILFILFFAASIICLVAESFAGKRVYR